jgi:predicted RNA-binding Zn ribbon-like protein
VAEVVVPPEAAALIEVLNSRHLGPRPDLLSDPDRATAVFTRAGLGPPDTRLEPESLAALRTARDALNDVLDDTLDEPAHECAWGTIDQVAAGVGVTLRLAAGPTAGLRPAAGLGSGETVLAEFLIRLHQAITSGSLRRLRRCANPVCDIAFYDGTRSRTQRWHSYARCGNRCNVAAYRSRARSH